MATSTNSPTTTGSTNNFPLSSRSSILILLILSAAIYIGNAASPPLLDDADSTHALVVQEMLQRHDWVVMYMDGIRYLEKAPLHYWLVAVMYEITGQQNSFTTRFPLALAVIGLVLMAYFFGRRFFGERAGFYAGLTTCTSIGIFLFTRIMIPEAIFGLELTAAFLLFLLAWNKAINPTWGMWGFAALAGLAVITLGLIGVVFPVSIVVFFIIATRDWARWRDLKIFSCLLIFLAIALPWHLIAEHRCKGFLWSYIVNEHFKRALGTRYPPDYDSVPLGLWWTIHLIWFAPWSIFLPFAFREFPLPRTWGRTMTLANQARLFLFIWAALIMAFFSVESGSRMEYYGFGAWPAICILLALGLAHAEELASRWLPRLNAALAVVGIFVAAGLSYFVYQSLHIHSTGDIATLLKSQSTDLYRLSMAHFLDLTPAAFADLRLQATLAAAVGLFGFGGAWLFRARRKQLASTLTLACSMAVFFFAANSAYAVFSPKLSSKILADDIRPYLHENDQIVLYGDITYGSTIPYYLQRKVWIYNGLHGSNLEYGAAYPDAPKIFLDDSTFPALWNQSETVFLFVPGDFQSEAFKRLPTDDCYLFAESGEKYVFVNHRIKPGMKKLTDLEAQLRE